MSRTFPLKRHESADINLLLLLPLMFEVAPCVCLGTAAQLVCGGKKVRNAVLLKGIKAPEGIVGRRRSHCHCYYDEWQFAGECCRLELAVHVTKGGEGVCVRAHMCVCVSVCMSLRCREVS